MYEIYKVMAFDQNSWHRHLEGLVFLKDKHKQLADDVAQ